MLAVTFRLSSLSCRPGRQVRMKSLQPWSGSPWRKTTLTWKNQTEEALEMLLSGGPPTAQGHPLADYHYAGSDRWTPEEKEAFQKAFHTYGKDFHLIQKQIPSKTVAQCVEYYYCWKKEQKLASSTLAQVSGKKIQTCQQGQETGRRAQTLLVSHTRRRFARLPWSHALGEAQQVLPRLLLCCCPEIRNCGAQL
ncbi:transcriptional-regulating factor 1-like isoform X2 [Passer domesticus]